MLVSTLISAALEHAVPLVIAAGAALAALLNWRVASNRRRAEKAEALLKTQEERKDVLDKMRDSRPGNGKHAVDEFLSEADD